MTASLELSSQCTHWIDVAGQIWTNKPIFIDLYTFENSVELCAGVPASFCVRISEPAIPELLLVNVGNSRILHLVQFVNDAILHLVEQYAKWSPAQCIGGTCSLLLLGDFCGGPRIGLVSHRQKKVNRSRKVSQKPLNLAPLWYVPSASNQEGTLSIASLQR